ncbi:MAG: hypothetical protein J0H66_09155 [Solirubrobacterales bacterium]|nr:hypothetical protein [Solirubrobacterales bacterium]
MASRIRFVLLVPLAALLLLGGLAATAEAAPANDNFASSQTLNGALPITVPGNDIGATAEAGEPMVDSIPPMRSVWYSWTAPDTKAYVLDTCHDGFTGGEFEDPVLGIYSGPTLATLVSVAGVNGRCALRFAAASGVTYHFQVDYYDNEGTFKLTLRNFTPPVNDDFATPTVIGPALPLTVNATTVDSTWEVGEPPSLGGSSRSRSVWFSWTAPTTQRIRLSLCEKTMVDGPLNDTTIVYTGSTLATLAPVASLTSNDCNMDFPVTAGTNYRIAVSGSDIGEFTFVLKLKPAPPPANDDFANAQVIGPNLPVDVTGNNDFATEEAGEPDHGGYPDTSRSVWYSWTAPVSGPMRVKTCNPDLQLFTSVYTGTLLTALTDVSERQSWAPCSRYFNATAGTTYKIAVAGAPFESTHGPFSLNLHKVAIPANDAFTSAVNLGSTLDTSADGTTVDATWEENEPGHTEGYGGDYGGSVWYRWLAPNDNPVVLSACSPVAPNRLAVFTPDPEAENPGKVDGLKLIDSDDGSCRDGSKGGRLAIAPVKGDSYFIGVTSAVADYESTFTLKLKGTELPIISKPSGFNLKKAIAKCKKIKGKGKKAKRKRARCIKKAKLKAAIIKCKKIKKAGKQAKCIKKARKRYR